MTRVPYLRQLAYGLLRAVPPYAAAAWGARWNIERRQNRWVVNYDLAEQSLAGPEAEQQALWRWLGRGAIEAARRQVEHLLQAGAFTLNSAETVTLHQENGVTIVGNPNNTGMYLYLAGWLDATAEITAHGTAW